MINEGLKQEVNDVKMKFIIKIFNILTMLGKQSHRNNNEPACKKIQNYIFNFNDLLGSGNFSKVYKAHHEITKHQVAIKIIELNSLKSKKLEQLLFSEIDVLKKLNHPNVLQCYEVFTSNRNCYIITQLCNGGDLESQLRSVRYFSEQKAKPIISDIFNGLIYLAQKNVIHRDLKVANIFLHNGKAKIADFGFAKFTKQKFKDMNIGSPIYMSPEGLIQNVYGPKTDIWSFGVMLFELLHGQTPFTNCRTENELRHAMSIPISWSRLKSQLSSQLKEVIVTCLEIQEEKRDMPYMRKLLNRPDFESLALPSTQEFNAYKPGQLSHSSEVYIHDKHQNRQPINRQRILLSIPSQSYRTRQRSHTPVRPSSDIQFKTLHLHPSPYQNNQKRGVSANRNLMEKYSAPTRQIEGYSKILSVPINFKVCVNFLHYCRLLYKHILMLRQSSYSDSNQLNVFVRWLSIILKTLNKKIQDKEINYQGENSAIREKKLTQVAFQYQKKYSKQLGIQMGKVNIQDSSANYQFMKNYFNSIMQPLDIQIVKQNNIHLLNIGLSMSLICSSTTLLQKCYQQRNYRRLYQYKQIQNFLSLDKREITLLLYLDNRKKRQ